MAVSHKVTKYYVVIIFQYVFEFVLIFLSIEKKKN